MRATPRFTLVLALCLVAFASPLTEAFGQTTAFNCSRSNPATSSGPGAALSGDAVLTRKPVLTFETVRNPSRITGIRNLPSKSLTGFGGRYGIRRITFFAQIEPSDRIDFTPGKARIHLEVQSSAGGSTFYTAGEFAISAAHDTDLSHLNVFPATPDQTVPLLILEVFAHSFGMNSGSSGTARYLIDFRQGKPQSIADLDCVEYEAGGACNAFDALYYQERSLECQWAPARTDFLCTHSRTNVWHWGHTSWKERFYLISGNMLWPPEIDVNAPASLREWVPEFRSSPPGKARDHTVLPGAGDTFILWDPRMLNMTLLASRGDTAHLWPKFTLAVVADNRYGYARELEVRTLEPSQTGARQEVQPFDFTTPVQGIAPGILTGEPMAFSVKPLVTVLPDLQVQFLQVLLTQNGHHSLFWVGVDHGAYPFQAQALLIATDASEYDGCRQAHVLASAASVHWTGRRPVLATLDVEPRRLLDSEGAGYLVKYAQEGGGPCPYDVELGWSYENGWRITPKSRACDLTAVTIRAISVSGRGEITARSAKISPDRH